MSLEGRIEVDLVHDGARVTAVALRNLRPADPGRMFVGRGPVEVTAMLPLLFSLCGQAQWTAGRMALEQAAEPTPVRRFLLACETVLEQGQSALRDWPALLGEAPDLAAARGLRAALGPLRGARAPDADDAARRLAEARRLLERAVFAGPAAHQLADLRPWRDWARTGATPAARLIRHVEDNDLGGFGASGVPLLVPPDTVVIPAKAGFHAASQPGKAVGNADRIARPGNRMDPSLRWDDGMIRWDDEVNRILAADDGSFLRQPEWDGSPRLTHPLARRAGHPVVAALLLSHGTGLLPLFAARLADLQACLDEAETLLPQLAPEPEPVWRDGAGLGLVAAARGLLAHRAEVRDGVINRYQILAPTEWTFHPAGVLQALRGAIVDDGLEQRARLLLAALDPCVACALRLIYDPSQKSGNGAHA